MIVVGFCFIFAGSRERGPGCWGLSVFRDYRISQFFQYILSLFLVCFTCSSVSLIPFRMLPSLAHHPDPPLLSFVAPVPILCPLLAPPFASCVSDFSKNHGSKNTKNVGSNGSITTKNTKHMKNNQQSPTTRFCQAKPR